MRHDRAVLFFHPFSQRGWLEAAAAEWDLDLHTQKSKFLPSRLCHAGISPGIIKPSPISVFIWVLSCSTSGKDRAAESGFMEGRKYLRRSHLLCPIPHKTPRSFSSPTQGLGTQTSLQTKRQSSKIHKAEAFYVTWNCPGGGTASGFESENLTTV